MSRRARERTVIIQRGGSSLWWFLVGGALGAGLALLFAPQSGDRTRRVVGRKLGKLRDAADEALDELRDAWSPGDERLHRSLAQTEPEADEKEDAGSETEADAVESNASGHSRPAPARQELERRLAEARARRQRALTAEDEEPVA
jgi:gas vesicle protein